MKCEGCGRKASTREPLSDCDACERRLFADCLSDKPFICEGCAEEDDD